MDAAEHSVALPRDKINACDLTSEDIHCVLMRKTKRKLFPESHVVYNSICISLFLISTTFFYYSLFSGVFFILFIFRQWGRQGEGEGEKHQCVVASCALPTGDLARNPSRVPQLGIELGTLWFAGWHSIR